MVNRIINRTKLYLCLCTRLRLVASRSGTKLHFQLSKCRRFCEQFAKQIACLLARYREAIFMRAINKAKSAQSISIISCVVVKWQVYKNLERVVVLPSF